jgi:hypothetical protein
LSDVLYHLELRIGNEAIKNISAQSLVDFRTNIHSSFPYRSDATMDLIDAIASNISAKSPVELSLNPLFHRQYASLHDAVDNFLVPMNLDMEEEERIEHQQNRMRIVFGHCPKPTKRSFSLLAIDTTGGPRPFADTLMDRGIHYHPNPAPGNRPITVGHSFSVVATLPEKNEKNSPPWVVPLLIRRVPTDKKAIDVGADQVAEILQDKSLPFAGVLSALTADSTYSAREFLSPMVKHPNLVLIVRGRGNRTFYKTPSTPQSDSSKDKGHPVWYGTPFNMKATSTWGQFDLSEIVPLTFRNGRDCLATIEAWYNMLMRGKHGSSMHEHPFTLMRITVKDTNGKAVFKRSLWLIVIGKRNREISLSDAYQAYRQRYDIEHFFRFGKNKLLLNSYQTPDVEHEQNWWEIVGLAYAQLYISAPLAQNQPRPWERYLPEIKEHKAWVLPSPSMVQRDMSAIIREIGTPARLPKPRGKSPGRLKGQSPGKRNRSPVIKKNTQKGKKYDRSP